MMSVRLLRYCVSFSFVQLNAPWVARSGMIKSQIRPAVPRYRRDTLSDRRRIYFDHDPVYRRIAAAGGRGWDDRCADQDQGSYRALEWFLASEYCPPNARQFGALDLGCGGGQVALRLAELGFRVTGVDFSEAAIELARRNAAAKAESVVADGAGPDRASGVTETAAELLPEIRLVVGDCRSLPQFADEEFQLVVDNHVLHCLIGSADRLAFLGTARRLLKPGGIFFSETMSAEGALDMTALGIDPATRIDKHHSRFWVTASELNEELNAAGFEILYQEIRPDADQPCPGDAIITVATPRSA